MNETSENTIDQILSLEESNLYFKNETKFKLFSWFENSTILDLATISLVCIVCSIIICSNGLILAALYRYKRLRTASNYFIASLASSDFCVGLSFPVAFYLQSSLIAHRFSPLCVIPYSIVLSFSNVSVIIMASIAVDRFTSLAQPLKYNNLITRASAHRYILIFWLYSLTIGFTPFFKRLFFQSDYDFMKNPCDMISILTKDMQSFLICFVYAPCSAAIIGCYGYIYVVARGHARAIYIVENSLRQSQDNVHSKYGQTLAVTVGFFVILWLPFQMLLIFDAIRGTHVLENHICMLIEVPILINSALNPWLYGFRNSELRTVVKRVIEKILKRLGYRKHKYKCPVNIIITSPGESQAKTDLELKSSKSHLKVPIRYTAVVMSSLNDPEKTSTSTTVCRIDSVSGLPPESILDLNGFAQHTSF